MTADPPNRGSKPLRICAQRRSIKVSPIIGILNAALLTLREIPVEKRRPDEKIMQTHPFFSSTGLTRL